MWRTAMLVALLMLSSCTFLPAFPLKTSLEATPTINTQLNRQPLPVPLVVYQLNDSEPFKKASFEALLLNEKKTLGDTVLEEKTYVLSPSEIKNITLDIKPKATHIAVAAFFRTAYSKKWKAYSLMPNSIKSYFKPLKILVNKNKVQIV